jgi:hypothetical protein
LHLVDCRVKRKGELIAHLNTPVNAKAAMTNIPVISAQNTMLVIDQAL